MVDSARRIGIVGTGLIGGSLGLAYRENGHHVVGVDTSEGVLEAALAAGAIDEGTTDYARLKTRDAVILATPIDSLVSIAGDVSAALRPNTLLMDTGSVKGTLVEDIERVVADQIRYLGSHPMFGTEGEGIQCADGRLVSGAPCYLTPTEATEATTLEEGSELVRAAGMHPIICSASEHDAHVAMVSHLPYLIAVALTQLGDSQEGAGPSFWGATRVAASPTEMWCDILRHNQAPVNEAVERFVDVLQRLNQTTGDALSASLTEARTQRLRGRDAQGAD